MELAGSVAVVTGASSGIGWSTAWALAGRGATVVLSARREARLQALARAIEERGGTAVPIPCDVTSRLQVEALAARVEQEVGRCDVLVNNAGVPGGGSFVELPLDDLERVIRTDYLGVVYGTKAFLPMLLAGGRGHVVNVASMAGRYAIPGSAVYSSAKHAVVAFSESLNYELAPLGVLVTAVNPALVRTEGFPHRDANPLATVSVTRVAEVIVDVVERGRAPEISVPRWLAAFQAFRVLTPGLYRFGVSRAVRSGLRASRVGEAGEGPEPATVAGVTGGNHEGGRTPPQT
jgi:short-subunit dehydrogenase